MNVSLATIEDIKNSDIEALIEKHNETREHAIKQNNEDLANNCWRNINIIKLNTLFIETFEKIKNKKHLDAWCDLEQCEILCHNLIENSDDELLDKSRVHFISSKVKLWQSLFPYKVFISPGFVVGYYTCGICNHKIRPRSRCEHVKGKIYWGKLCTHQGHELEIREISLVTKPVQKYSVATAGVDFDYSLVNYLIDKLDHAFEEWDVNWTTKNYLIDRFSSVQSSDDCPCKSGNKFNECCKNNESIDIPHVDFFFQKKLPKSKEGTVFPY